MGSKWVIHRFILYICSIGRFEVFRNSHASRQYIVACVVVVSELSGITASRLLRMRHVTCLRCSS